MLASERALDGKFNSFIQSLGYVLQLTKPQLMSGSMSDGNNSQIYQLYQLCGYATAGQLRFQSIQLLVCDYCVDPSLLVSIIEP